jgi:transposase
VGQGGRLYIGDVKMAALSTRAFIEAGQDYYLTPLPKTGNVPDLLVNLLEQVWAGKQPLQQVYKGPNKSEATSDLLALGYETTRRQRGQVGQETVSWDERVFVVYSPWLAKRQRRGLAQRLARAEEEVRALTPPRGRGRKQWDELAPLQRKVESVLKRRRVADFLSITYEREVERRQIRG